MKIKSILFVSSLICSITSLVGQNTYTFTNCGSTGQFGPSQVNADNAYNATSLDGDVIVNSDGVQQWEIPVTGQYHIEVYGAEGGSADVAGTDGGKGAKMTGDFNLVYGDTIKILIGQAGGAANYGGGGGGGSFVVTSLNTPLIIAGGGGGGNGGNPGFLSRGTFNGEPGLISQNGGNSNYPTGSNGSAAPGVGGGGVGLGGSDGYGGGSGAGAGGGGFYDNGASDGASLFGSGYLNGGAGGAGDILSNFGGFGGGGGGRSGTGYAGGAGGYSGGGGGNWNSTYGGNGGGGGSYNEGTNKVDISGVNIGHGKVVISRYCLPLDVTVTNNSPTLIANATLVNYRWLDCNNSNSVIVGETNQSFSPISNGNYSVEVSIGGCVDTSLCTVISNVSISENDFQSRIIFYPNPTNGFINLELKNEFNIQEISISDIQGRIVFQEQNFTESKIKIDLSDFNNGVYMLNVRSEDAVVVYKIIKQE